MKLLCLFALTLIGLNLSATEALEGLKLAIKESDDRPFFRHQNPVIITFDELDLKLDDQPFFRPYPRAPIRLLKSNPTPSPALYLNIKDFMSLQDHQYRKMKKPIIILGENKQAQQTEHSLNDNRTATVEPSSDQYQPSRQAKSEAIEFCHNEINSHYQTECLEIVAPGRFVDRGALDMCAGLPSHSQLGCLATIVDRLYEQGIIEECQNQQVHKQIHCLSLYGMPTVYDLQPAFTVRMPISPDIQAPDIQAPDL